MIQIDDKDLPIMAAEKLITGTREMEDGIVKTANKYLGGNGQCDLFTVEELHEISEYLRVYCENHERGDS